jgi:phage-related protein (TIGR01555 family)
MLLDKDREEIVQVNTPLSGLHELQAQAQEHLCSISRIPAVILTGISPSGLNASSDGEVRVFYDWISAQQEACWSSPLDTMLKVLQLSLWGEIDSSITWHWNPLWQLNELELADIRLKESQTAGYYIDQGVLSPEDVRTRLARDPESGWEGIDVSALPEPPMEPMADPFAEVPLDGDPQA